LRLALTHRSYAFEQGGLPNNERLEFLGDAVLGLVITDMIFVAYPDLAEGGLAKLRAGTVNMLALAEVAKQIGLGDQLLLGKGEEASGGRGKSSILADGLEAVIGAIYLDQGIGQAQAIVRKLFEDVVRNQVELRIERDFKTSLQETAAALGGLIPDYQVTGDGPDHSRRFHARVFLGDERVGEGTGKSKKEAEQAAACKALKSLERRVMPIA